MHVYDLKIWMWVEIKVGYLLKFSLQSDDQPKPAPRSKFGDENQDFGLPDLPNIPDLPSVPGGNTFAEPSDNKDDIDFDDLTKRFEDLKKKK